MNRIIVVGDLSSTNLGDPLLTQCCGYIVKHVLGEQDIPIELFDIAGRRPAHVKTSSYHPVPNHRKSRLFGFVREEIMPVVRWFLRDARVFCKRMSRIDSDNAIFIIAGGALISSSLFYALRLHEIVRIAHRHNGKVIFNSVGIEKSVYNHGLAKYIIRNLLKQKEVVAFSTRDHVEDVPYLTNRNGFYRRTPDPGLFTSETYAIKKKDAQLVGLSVISYQAYQSIVQDDNRATKVTADYLIQYWSAIIRHLQQMKIDFRILTNGGMADYAMAKRLVSELKLDEQKYLMPLPKTPSVLVSQLSMFRMVIAHRLHACIISTSLNIPIIPIIWSDKLRVFAEMIDNRFATWPEIEETTHFDEVINKALNEPVDISVLKEEIINYLTESINLAQKYE